MQSQRGGKRRNKRRNTSVRKTTSANPHKRRLFQSSTVGLILGSLLCFLMWDADLQMPSVPGVQLSLNSSGNTELTEILEEKAEASEAAVFGPEKVIDVSQVHPALGKEVGNAIVQKLPENHEVTFTVIPSVQARAESILAKNDVPYGAVVAIRPKTGEILALVDYEAQSGLHTGFALQSSQPAASVFKVITSAALMEHAGIAPEHRVCYHGGRSGITAAHLKPNRKLDTTCRTLAQALSHSSNVIFARLADSKLSVNSLNQWGEQFGFNREIPFLWSVEKSRLQLPSDRVKFAGAAAGFHYSHISPLHGALLTAAVGNAGDIPIPRLVRSIARDGVEIYSAESGTLGRAIAPATAKDLAKMMTLTTKSGTGAKYFRKRHEVMKGIPVAGKTGSLSNTIGGARRHNSWFVGFAPADDPEIAVAALVVNDLKWRIKGTYLAREVMEEYFLSQRKSPTN